MHVPHPQVGLSLMPQMAFLETVRPLFQSGLVDIVEWSFDLGWGPAALPAALRQILTDYSQRDRLLGHGVSYSLLSAEWDSRPWLACLKAECADFQYRQISEHLGWMAAGAFSQSAPLPMPMLPEVVQIGCDRLCALADAAQVPVGLENLAFAFSRRDVLEQGEFLQQLLAPVQGFILLDLHNLYCQMHNFQLGAAEILSTYPLELVRELHLSGGSWSPTQGQCLRRDTHDDTIPTAVFDLLRQVLPLCPNLEFVIVERLGQTLIQPAQQYAFQQEFAKVRTIVASTLEVVS